MYMYSVPAQETAKDHAKLVRWLTSGELRRCSNEAETRNPLKFAGVSETGKPISGVSGRKFAILWGHVEEILLFNNFFPIVDTCHSCEDIALQLCAMVPRWRYLRKTGRQTRLMASFPGQPG